MSSYNLRASIVLAATFVTAEFGAAIVEWLEGSAATAMITLGIGVWGGTFCAWLDYDYRRKDEMLRKREADLDNLVAYHTARGKLGSGPINLVAFTVGS